VVAAIFARDPALPEHAGQLTPVLARLLAKDPGSRPSASETARTLAGGRYGTPAAWPAPGAGQVTPGAGQVPPGGGHRTPATPVPLAATPLTITVTPSPGLAQPSDPAQPVAMPAPVPASRRRRKFLAITLPLVLVAIAAGAYFGLSSPGQPPPVGDACLIGTWRDGGYDTSTTWQGTTVIMHGAGGNLDHISASGTDEDVYGPGTAPLYGTYQGHTLEQIDKGTAVQVIRASPGTHTASVVARGWASGSTDTYVYQGQTTAGTFGKATGTADKFSYACTATALRWTYEGQVDSEARVSSTP